MNELRDDAGATVRGSPTVRLDQLPAPRLQLRWELNVGERRSHFAIADDQEWLCHYELVLPLGEYDIRREIYEDDEQIGERELLIVPMRTPTIRTSAPANQPCRQRDGAGYYDPPIRDGAHAQWDAKVLGDLPIFVVAPDGTAFTRDRDDGSSPKNPSQRG